MPLPPVASAEDLIEQIAAGPAAIDEQTPAGLTPPVEDAAATWEILREMAREEGCTFQGAAELFQDFSVRLRMQRLVMAGMDVTKFRRRFAMAVAGVVDPEDPALADILRLGSVVSEDLLAPFLSLALAALNGAPCPDDAELARVYGTSSPGRIRRLIDHFEKTGLFVIRTDFSGRRSVTIPELGLSSAPALQDA